MIKSFRAKVGEYLIQISIIVFSIMLSFLLNEWRNSITNKQIERDILEGLVENLQADSISITNQKLAVAYFVRGYNHLLNYETLEEVEDSLYYWVDAAISYSKVGLAEVAYEEMKQSGTSMYIRNKELHKEIVNLYTKYYLMMKEWNDIDKNFILNQMIPYMDENFPYVVDNRYETLVKDNPKQLDNLLKADHFLNLINKNKMFKGIEGQVYEINLQAISRILTSIRAELAEL